MHVTDFFEKIFYSIKFQEWSKNKHPNQNIINRFVSDLGVNLTNKCNMNCDHCCFKEHLNKDDVFDFDIFYDFLIKFLIFQKNQNVNHVKLHLNCGEITLIPYTTLFNFLNTCLKIYNNLGIKLSFRINSNLKKLTEKDLLFFKTCKEISESFGEEFLLYTSVDEYHFENKNFEKHLINMNKLNAIGIKVLINSVVGDIDFFNIIHNKYSSLESKFVVQLYKDFENLNSDMLLDSKQNELHKKIDTLAKIENVQKTYHVNGCYNLPLRIIYTYNNSIVHCPFFAPFETRGIFNINPKNVNAIEDVYNSPLYLIQRYLNEIANQDMANICPILHYYKKVMK